MDDGLEQLVCSFMRDYASFVCLFVLLCSSLFVCLLIVFCFRFVG